MIFVLKYHDPFLKVFMLISDEPLLSGQPLLSRQLPLPQGWLLNRGAGSGDQLILKDLQKPCKVPNFDFTVMIATKCVIHAV